MTQGLLIAIGLWIFCGGYITQLHSATLKESKYFKIENERVKVFAEKLKGIYIPEINPCDDYVEYTTGNISVDLVFRSNHRKEFESFFNNNIKNNENIILNGEKQMKIFFESCYNNLPDTFEESVKNVDFKDFGHFPVYETNWSEEKFSWSDTETRLHNYGMQILLKSKVRESYDGSYVFKLAPADIIDFKLSSDSKPPEQLELILNHLGFSNDIIQNLTNIFTELESKIRLLYEDDSEENEPKTIGWLQENIPKIDWIKYFDNVSSYKSKDTDHIHIHLIETIKAIINLAENTDKHILANYYNYRIYLNLYKVFESLQENKEECYKHVYRHFEDYALNLILEVYFDEHDLINLNNSLKIAIKLRNELQKQENDNIYLKGDIKQLESLLKIIQNRIIHTQSAAKYYDDIELNKTNFFKNSLILKNLNNQIKHDPNLREILTIYQNFANKPRIYVSYIFSLFPTTYGSANYKNLSKNCIQIRTMQNLLSLFTKSLTYFKEDNEEWFSNEQTSLAKHDLTYNKIFFTLFGTFYEPTTNEKYMKNLLALEEFVEEYHCTNNELAKSC